MIDSTPASEAPWHLFRVLYNGGYCGEVSAPDAATAIRWLKTDHHMPDPDLARAYEIS